MLFPKWRPDAPAYDDGTLTGLVTCRNVYPDAGGYKPFRDLTAATASLGAAWVGGGAFEYNGNTAFLGATAAKLRAHASGAWSDKFTLATTSPWFFAQFGPLVIGVNGTQAIKYTLSTATAAALGGSPPNGATQIAIVRGFTVMSGVSSSAQTVYWSGLEDAEGWTVGTNQADTQIIPDGGPITGLSGGEYGVVFQNTAISVMEYVGTPNIFTFRKVEDSIGCIAQGSIVRDGQMHYFLSRKGFKGWSPQSGIAHIGANAVDDTFLASYSLSQIIGSMRATVDPDSRIIIWSMPDALWIYNLETDAWSKIEVAGIVGLSSGVSGSAATLESIAAIFPSLEDVTPSLDDPFWNAGAGKPLLYVFKTDFIGYTFAAGSPLEATLKTQIMEPNQGRISHVRNTRLITDAVDQVTLNVDVARRPGDMQTRVSTSDLRSNGDLPLRASGGCLQMEWVLNGNWTYLKGFELDAAAGGRL